MNDIIKALKNKTTWAGISIILTAALPLSGVPPKVCAGILTAFGGLALIFLRQGIDKIPPK